MSHPNPNVRLALAALPYAAAIIAILLILEWLGVELPKWPAR